MDGDSPFPRDDEAQLLTVGPESVTWQFGSDVRLYLAPLYPLLLQVAHPTVAAGVRDYSDFDRRPWQRLAGTMTPAGCSTTAAATQSRCGPAPARGCTSAFRGTRGPTASPTTALEREAYAWVHATLIEATSAGQPPLRPADDPAIQVERFYQESLGLGRLVGVREGDLPPDWTGFQTYFERYCLAEATRTELRPSSAC